KPIAAGEVPIRFPFPLGDGLFEVTAAPGSAAAGLLGASAIARDATGTLWIADTGHHVIKRLDANGTVTVVAGDGTQGNADGPAAKARLFAPGGVAVTPDGSKVYIADTGNHAIRVLAGG